MAMTLQGRVAALDNGTAFRRTIIGAIAKHAFYVRGAQGQSENSQKLARAVLRAPDAFAYRIGIVALIQPTYDAVEATEDIPDGQIQDTVGELWPALANAEFEVEA